MLRGLIYVSQRLSLDDPFGETFVQGTIIVHDELFAEGGLFLEYRDIFWQAPPPGFHNGSDVKIEPGSFEYVESP